MSVKHIVDFYFNTDGNSTEHRISIKVTLSLVILTYVKQDIYVRFVREIRLNQTFRKIQKNNQQECNPVGRVSTTYLRYSRREVSCLPPGGGVYLLGKADTPIVPQNPTRHLRPPLPEMATAAVRTLLYCILVQTNFYMESTAFCVEISFAYCMEKLPNFK